MPVIPKFETYSRRDLIQIAAASLAASGCSPWMSSLLRAAAGARPKHACILLWMSGGPSQLETLDPKTGHANGGPTRSIATAVPGIQLAHNLPKVAEQMRDMALIRSLSTREGDHGRATQLMMTGYRPSGMTADYPVLGSMVARQLHVESSPLPGFVSIAPSRLDSLGPGFLGARYAPLVVSGASDDPRSRANLTVENLTPLDNDMEAARRRQQLLGLLRQGVNPGVESAAKHAAIYDSAMVMVEPRGEGAFDLDDEPAELRDAYGRNRFGQGCLLARRLVERGVPFVEVALGSTGNANWDSNVNNFQAVSSLSEVLDPAWATLISNLSRCGLIQSTLFVCLGEFGRTPKINTATGRDHFPDAWSVALAGSKIKGGQVVGATSRDAMEITDRPVTAADLFATVLEAIGIDWQDSNWKGDRPIPMVDSGTPISELV
jgi:uncharacterized protein (DUF1501 family)